jgi:pyruvate carboxylase
MSPGGAGVRLDGAAYLGTQVGGHFDSMLVKLTCRGRDLPAARKQTEAIAQRLSTGEILHRIRRLEELRDYLGRNIQEALALEVTFLKVFHF